MKDGHIRIINSSFLNCKVIELKENVGFTMALNAGLEHCENELIFRVDTDDINYSNRFELQLNYLNEHPEISILGAQICLIDSTGRLINQKKTVPKGQRKIRLYRFFKNPLNHPTVVFKKSVILKIGGYKNVMFYEDWYLWCELLSKENIIFENLSETLVKYRIRNITERHGWKFLKYEYFFYRELKNKKILNPALWVLILFLKLFIKISPKPLYRLVKKIYSQI